MVTDLLYAYVYLYIFLSDVDECSLGTHNCSHICKNTLGTYICDCHLGCQIDADDRLSCQGNIMSHAITMDIYT